MASATSFRQIIGAQPSTASPTDSTLVIIDAQNEYAEGKLAVSEVAASRKAIASLLQRYRDAKGSIVHVVHDTPEGAPVFTPGSNLADEFDELKPRDGEKVVHKNFPGSFAGTDLQEHLDGKGAAGKKIVLTGYMAHVCVSTTARQAAQRGYDVLVAEDAVGDRDIPGVDAAQLTKVALSEIGDAFGTVVQSKDIA
ncbi:putative isochorismatase family protein YddQ [Colletotrichum spinosum]|uniref:Putative isochorismatase family protein YddQ n=1 Tax=Colletotrichum spinosum TaxID=1347390 RepID=A0A4R8PXX1_9PEZI|nr:putative isochorismatase family protein YddQ [Colletotrichum spinosum]